MCNCKRDLTYMSRHMFMLLFLHGTKSRDFARRLVSDSRRPHTSAYLALDQGKRSVRLLFRRGPPNQPAESQPPSRIPAEIRHRPRSKGRQVGSLQHCVPAPPLSRRHLARSPHLDSRDARDPTGPRALRRCMLPAAKIHFSARSSATRSCYCAFETPEPSREPA
jgi:hypothetical protein